MKNSTEKFSAELAGYEAEKAARVARGEDIEYVEDTTALQAGYAAAREMTFSAELERQQSGPDPLEIESHWYLMADE